MNNNSIAINNYLQNEMTADEKSSFEARLSADKDLQQEFHIQQQLITAAVNAGIKEKFGRALRQRILMRKIVLVAIIVIVLVALLFTYKNKQGNYAGIAETTSVKTNLPYINPPLAGINVPFSEYTVDAEKADIIFHYTGSIIYFPASSFTDNKGNPVKGKITITYREFADPLDFFVSGIPMDYDSAGRKYNFESSGMCEIMAYKGNQILSVNLLARPVIYLSGKNKSDLHNVYFLDTVARKWNYIGKDTITAVKGLADTKNAGRAVLPAREMDIFTKPTPPAKASDRPSFSIEIDPGSFEELFTYDKMKLEVLDEKTYKRSDADEHWDNVKLDHTATEGIYTITFKNNNRSVTYKVKPVLEGEDYENALKIFNQKNKAYELALKNRLDNDQRFSDSLTALNKLWQQKSEAEVKRNNAINALIIERNRRIREIKAAELQESERQRLIMQEIQKDAWKFQGDQTMSNEILRSFTISSFGIWNCDHPQYPGIEIPIYSSFESEEKKLELKHVAVVYQSFNGITNFPANQIRIIPNKENMLWGIKDSSFYYFSYKDFQQANIQRGMTSFKFKMRKAGQAISSYEDIKKLVEKF
jgi:hypothetical protein